MNKWLRRVRGAVGMGLTWAAEWLLLGLLIGLISKLVPGSFDWFFEIFDAPLPALAVPGFFGGMFFSAVLGTAGRRRKFSELSLPGFTAWGALGGVLLSLFPAALVGLGLATPRGSVWSITAAILGPVTVFSAASAATTLMLARKSEDRRLVEATSEVGLTDGEARDLIGDGREAQR